MTSDPSVSGANGIDNAPFLGDPVSTAIPVGLTGEQARQRLAQFGPNAITEMPSHRWKDFLAKFWAPVPWMLEAAIVLQIGLGAFIEAAMVGALLLFNATLGLIQEGRAGAALIALKERLALSAIVRRDGQWIRLAASELVPGDAVRLPLGVLVPADVRIVSGAVMVDQSMLTGESVPVDTSPGSEVYAGAIVRRGQALAEVTATGKATYFGRAAELVRVAHAASTEQSAVFAVTRNLVAINGTVAALIIVYAYALALPVADLVRLALTAVLATVPVALPATFTLSAAFAAQVLARQGVLLTRLSAAHEAAAMDVLCVDKTGTLTRNTLEVVGVAAMPGFDRQRVLALAALASSDANQDPIDGAIRAAAMQSQSPALSAKSMRFVPFDPATKIAEAFVLDSDGTEQRIVKGAFEVVATLVDSFGSASPATAFLDSGHRVIAVAAGTSPALRMAGFVALSDPPRDDTAALISALGELHVRVLMVSGDSPATAANAARAVGIRGAVYPGEQAPSGQNAGDFGVFARFVPEQKYLLVQALQEQGHVVGMCGDGANDAAALRQAQIGIAVSTATDAAKAAAGMVMTEAGLAGIVFAIREGRIGFQRLLTYTFNMLVKKFEIVLFLAAGLALTGKAVMTPLLMVLLFMTNDFLSMSLTTDRASPATAPSVWRMRDIEAAAVVLGVCKLGFSTAILALGVFQLHFGTEELQTLAFLTLVLGNQATVYVLRERRRIWSSKPGTWVLVSSVTAVAVVSGLALSGTLMAPLPWSLTLGILSVAAAFALILDQIKVAVFAHHKIE
jgi:H+-transporting ATPase